MTIGQMMLGEFDQEMQNTRKVLERCPDEKWNWKPHEKSGTVGWLASHVATMVAWRLGQGVPRPTFAMANGKPGFWLAVSDRLGGCGGRSGLRGGARGCRSGPRTGQAGQGTRQRRLRPSRSQHRVRQHQDIHERTAEHKRRGFMNVFGMADLDQIVDEDDEFDALLAQAADHVEMDVDPECSCDGEGVAGRKFDQASGRVDGVDRPVELPAIRPGLFQRSDHGDHQVTLF